MFIEKGHMIGQSYINKTREYLNYLEEHFDNIRKAFQELSVACDGMTWVGDDNTWHTLRHEVCHHDISKFSTEEFVPYRNRFFPLDTTTEEDKDTFNKAWIHHYEVNEHHWEYINRLSDETTNNKPGLIERYLIHMLVDWTAMGYKFGDTAQEYYEQNKHKILLKPDQVEFIYTIFNRLAKRS